MDTYIKSFKDMKIALFWEDRFKNNQFTNTQIDENLSPFKLLSQLNNDETISFDIFEKRENKNDFLILCFLAPSIFSLKEYFSLLLKYRKHKKYVFLFEPPVVSPLSYNKIFHYFFDKVYTWNDNLVDNKKYYKFIWPQSKFGTEQKVVDFDDKKFCTLINGNKYGFGENELYSARENIIRFFEKQKVDFELYGRGWDKANKIQKLFGFIPYTSYKGSVENKISTISGYKYNICFENMKDSPGYITEKIWDSFKAKTVPVYWGASNISDYIPENTFIDFRKFENNFENFLKHIESITKEQYEEYIKNIEIFLKSESAKEWFDEMWVKNILSILSK